MAFDQCSSLKHIVIPKKAKRIDTAAFCDCPILEIESHSSRFIVIPKGCKETYRKKMLEAVDQANANDNCMFSYRVLNKLRLDKFNNPEDYLSALLPVKYWDLLVEV